MQKKYATGRPDQKDLNENLAATQGLAHMIVECNRLFEVEEPADVMTQGSAGWVQYLQPPTSLRVSAYCRPHIMLLCTIRSPTRWFPSRVTRMWKPTCTHPRLASCASSWKTMMGRTQLTWRGDFRTFLKRLGRSPSTGCPAAALTTQSSTTRRWVSFIFFFFCLDYRVEIQKQNVSRASNQFGVPLSRSGMETL